MRDEVSVDAGGDGSRNAGRRDTPSVGDCPSYCMHTRKRNESPFAHQERGSRRRRRRSEPAVVAVDRFSCTRQPFLAKEQRANLIACRRYAQRQASGARRTRGLSENSDRDNTRGWAAALADALLSIYRSLFKFTVTLTRVAAGTDAKKAAARPNAGPRPRGPCGGKTQQRQQR